MSVDYEKAKQASILMLEAIGENPNRPGLKETPDRIAKMFQEVFRGYDKTQIPNITTFDNNEDDIQYNSMVLDFGYYFSYCEHHVVPFFGNYAYAYVPNNKVLGASKIARAIDYFSARLQVQERIGILVCNLIEEVASPLGQCLVINGRHLCKEMRGVQKFNSAFETIEARGVFLKNTNGIKDEFMSRIQGKV